MEASLRLNEKSQNESVARDYLMLLGSSRPYPWLILEESGHDDDDNNDDDS